ncbi:hypothetical protein [Mycobacterium lepromatosis]|nr:hypothetical protein [Mycobacterium lepromatosis]
MVLQLASDVNSAEFKHAMRKSLLQIAETAAPDHTSARQGGGVGR